VATLERLDADGSVRARVLTGAGGTFSAGTDLRAFLSAKSAEVPGRGFAGLTRTPPGKPLVAAVEGYALAGGFEMVVACDLVVSADDALFGLPEVKRGVSSRGRVPIPAGGCCSACRQATSRLAGQLN
jgi:enoyl-CoA hydratase